MSINPMDAADICLITIVLFVAGLVKGASGIGYSTCALPLLFFALGLKEAIALIVLPAFLSNISLLFPLAGLSPIVRRFWPFLTALLPGVVGGTFLLAHIDPIVSTRILGLITMAYVAMQYLRPEVCLSARVERLIGPPAGFLSGIVTGLTGSQSVPLLPYMLALRLTPAQLIQAVNLVVVVGTAAIGLSLTRLGMMDGSSWLTSLLAAMPALAGVGTGARIRRRLDADSLRRIILVVLALIGLSMALPHSAFIQPSSSQLRSAIDGVADSTITFSQG